MDSLITLNNISKSFGTRKILNNISFNISKRETIGLIGLNGTGKSTLISIIVGLLKPDSGTVNLNSTEIGIMFQDVSTPSQIKVFELIEMVIKFSKNPKTLSEVLKISNLQDKKNRFCSDLSGGQKRQLQFALAIANNPQLLILDEPTVGMDFKAKQNFFNYLKSISNDVSIILTSHDFEEINELSDRILILKDSQIICNEQYKEISTTSSRILKFPKDKIDLDILTASNLPFFKYKVYGEYIELYSEDINSLVKSLIQLGFSFNDFEITHIKLEEIIGSYLDKEVHHE